MLNWSFYLVYLKVVSIWIKKDNKKGKWEPLFWTFNSKFELNTPIITSFSDIVRYNY